VRVDFARKTVEHVLLPLVPREGGSTEKPCKCEPDSACERIACPLRE
jgi:hypothetical protein